MSAKRGRFEGGGLVHVVLFHPLRPDMRTRACGQASPYHFMLVQQTDEPVTCARCLKWLAKREGIR